MAADASLVDRVRRVMGRCSRVSERYMFGGVAFLVNGNMCCGVVRDLLVVRLGEKGAEAALNRPHTREMDFTGRPMRTMVYVESQGLRAEKALRSWVDKAVRFAGTLPL
jgi:TfoX/Sxy family transcriptional regulator of competence genes